MNRPRSTHTYAVLAVSQSTYDEIAHLLKEAGYDHAFHVRFHGTVIDMHGIGLASQEPPKEGSNVSKSPNRPRPGIARTTPIPKPETADAT